MINDVKYKLDDSDIKYKKLMQQMISIVERNGKNVQQYFQLIFQLIFSGFVVILINYNSL